MKYTYYIFLTLFIFVSYIADGKDNTPISYEKFLEKNLEFIDGIFPIYKGKNEVFLEVKEELFEKEILVISQINKGFDLIARPIESLGVVRVKKGENNSISFVREEFNERLLLKNDELSIPFEMSNNQPTDILFPIVASSKDGKGCIIDISKNVLNGEIFYKVVYPTIKNFDSKSSEIKEVNQFSDGVSFIVNQMYGYSPDRENTTGTMLFLPQGYMPIELACTIKILSKNDMDIRLATNELNLNTIPFWDYSQNVHTVAKDSLAVRWNLGVSNNKNLDYKGGKLIEPLNYITFYIDSNCPKEYVNSIKTGVLDVNNYFKSLGYKNVLKVSLADKNMHLEGKRAVISYDFGEKGVNSKFIFNYRTGEILSCRINIGHGFMLDELYSYLFEHGIDDNRIFKNEFAVAKVILTKKISNEVLKVLGVKDGISENDKSAIHWLYKEYPNISNCYGVRDMLRKNIYREEKNKEVIRRGIEDADKRIKNMDYSLLKCDDIATKDNSSALFINRKYVNYYFSCVKNVFEYIDKSKSKEDILLIMNWLNDNFINKEIKYESKLLTVQNRVGLDEMYLSKCSEVYDICIEKMIGDNCLAEEKGFFKAQTFFDSVNKNLFSSFDVNAKCSYRKLDLQFIYVNSLLKYIKEKSKGNTTFYVKNHVNKLKENIERLKGEHKNNEMKSFYEILFNKIKTIDI